MRAILGWGGAGVCGSLWWWPCAHAGLWAAIIPGAVGSGVRLYAGNRWYDDNLR